MTELEYFNGDELALTIWNKKYRYNEESFEEWLSRVSNNNPVIKHLIRKKKFIFGGRTLSNRGVKDGSYSNCYSIGYVEDDLKSILDVNTKLALTYKAQGGQGASLSKLRPKGTLIKEFYESDGIIPFMKLFNQTTSCISQGGSRKGALLLSLDIWHKEAANFITVKSNESEINKANLSLEIDDEFMLLVEDSYKSGINRIQHVTREYSGHIIEYDVDVLGLYKLLCYNALKHAEPGVIFTERFRNYNIMQYDSEYNIETCNPCGEQPLPKHGACNLSSINISEYILNPYTKDAKLDYESLITDVEYIVRAMDDVLTENLDRHALIEQREMAENYRNIGIGIMGLADAFVKLGYTYGDSDSVGFSYNLAKTIFRGAVYASVGLAQSRGSFPKYSPIVWESDIMKKAFSKEELDNLKETNMIRNCSLLSIAPTGSIGTMFNVSTGVEPFFQLSYIRKTETLNNKDAYYTVDVKAVSEYKEVTGNNNLPNYFVSSSDINWKDRIAIQAALQHFIDTAISSTINLPKETTQEDIEQIYLEGWKKGLKGLTVYVEGSREPILSDRLPKTIEGRQAPKRPKVLEADYYQVKVKKEQFIALVGLLEGKPYEVFAFRPLNPVNIPAHKGTITKVSKMHYSFDSEYINISNLELANTNIEENAATLYSSMLLRHGVDINYIIKTARKVNDNISSFSSAMCRILAKYIPNSEIKGEVCPDCGSVLIRENGCVHCSSCGWSRCS